MTNRLSTALALFISCSVLLCGCSSSQFPSSPHSDSSDEMKILTIGTADSGGTMYPAGRAIAQVIGDSDRNININISASNGSLSNVEAIHNGEIDLGLVSGDVAFDASNGSGMFYDTPMSDIRIIAAVYPSLSNWIAPASLEISYVHDLKGMRIGIGPQDSTTESSAKQVLKTLGISSDNSSLENCGLGSGADAVKNGSLDAVHGFAGIPITGISNLASQVPCRLLKYTPQELRAIVRENSFYYMDVIPAGTYQGQEEDVNTFGIKCLLCVRSDMDEDLVYELTSILYENTAALKEMHPALSAMSRKGFMYNELPIPLHPGAQRFYKEHGLLEE